jgi:uncharacterized membrane protein YhaH (DUF805 family)
LGGGLLKFAAFTGRASRKEFALAFAVNIALTAISLILVFTQRHSLWITTANWILSLVEAWLLIAAGVRRQHDLDKSGWLILLWIIPMVGLIFLAWWFGRPGTAGPNRYGPPPTV